MEDKINELFLTTVQDLLQFICLYDFMYFIKFTFKR